MSTGYSKNYNAPKGVHIMNKNESKELRKLKIKTGLKEEEIRKEKKYRILLSKAQKQKGNKTRFERNIISLVKTVTKKLSLPLEHPETIKEIDNYLKNNFYYQNMLRIKYTSLSGKKIIEIYRQITKK